MSRKKGKRSMIAFFAVLAAVVGGAVAVGAYLKKKARKLGEQLDYNGSLYYEDDDYVDEDEAADDEETKEAPAEEADPADDEEYETRD